jgi:dihydroneopterin aldolase
MDAIFIEDLRLDARVGIYPREQVAPQGIELNLEIEAPPGAFARDEIGATIDYAEVVARLEKEFAERHFNLLETLAEFVATLLIQDFGAPSVRLSVAKIGMMKNTRRVGVRIERKA